MSDSIPDEKVKDTAEDFENQSQINASDATSDAIGWRSNRKRTYDVYQDFDIQAVRQSHRLFDKLDNISVQALQNAVETANMVGKQAIRHSDVAADALWTDELNPTMHGAESVMAGQTPVNSQLSSTASLDTVYTNITAQVGVLTTLVATLAQSLATNNSAITALLAQMVENAKQTPK